MVNQQLIKMVYAETEKSEDIKIHKDKTQLEIKKEKEDYKTRKVSYLKKEWIYGEQDSRYVFGEIIGILRIPS